MARASSKGSAGWIYGVHVRQEETEVAARKARPLRGRPGALRTHRGARRGINEGMCLKAQESSIKEGLKVSEKGSTMMQRVAICFAAGVIGAVAVVLFGQILFYLGISAVLGVKAPMSLSPPGIYRPLFWGGLWGIPFGLLIKPAWVRLYLFGLLYFLLPVLALFVIFLPLSGAGLFGLKAGGPMFTLYLVLVNVPFGIVTALAARVIIGKHP